MKPSSIITIMSFHYELLTSFIHASSLSSSDLVLSRTTNHENLPSRELQSTTNNNPKLKLQPFTRARILNDEDACFQNLHQADVDQDDNLSQDEYMTFIALTTKSITVVHSIENESGMHISSRLENGEDHVLYNEYGMPVTQFYMLSHELIGIYNYFACGNENYGCFNGIDVAGVGSNNNDGSGGSSGGGNNSTANRMMDQQRSTLKQLCNYAEEAVDEFAPTTTTTTTTTTTAPATPATTTITTTTTTAAATTSSSSPNSSTAAAETTTMATATTSVLIEKVPALPTLLPTLLTSLPTPLPTTTTPTKAPIVVDPNDPPYTGYLPIKFQYEIVNTKGYNADTYPRSIERQLLDATVDLVYYVVMMDEDDGSTDGRGLLRRRKMIGDRDLQVVFSPESVFIDYFEDIACANPTFNPSTTLCQKVYCSVNLFLMNEPQKSLESSFQTKLARAVNDGIFGIPSGSGVYIVSDAADSILNVAQAIGILEDANNDGAGSSNQETVIISCASAVAVFAFLFAGSRAHKRRSRSGNESKDDKDHFKPQVILRVGTVSSDDMSSLEGSCTKQDSSASRPTVHDNADGIDNKKKDNEFNEDHSLDVTLGGSDKIYQKDLSLSVDSSTRSDLESVLTSNPAENVKVATVAYNSNDCRHLNQPNVVKKFTRIAASHSPNDRDDELYDSDKEYDDSRQDGLSSENSTKTSLIVEPRFVKKRVVAVEENTKHETSETSGWSSQQDGFSSANSTWNASTVVASQFSKHKEAANGCSNEDYDDSASEASGWSSDLDGLSSANSSILGVSLSSFVEAIPASTFAAIASASKLVKKVGARRDKTPDESAVLPGGIAAKYCVKSSDMESLSCNQTGQISSAPIQIDFDAAIEAGDWKAVSATAWLLAQIDMDDDSESHHSIFSRESDISYSVQDRTSELKRMAEDGDWEGILKAASKYDGVSDAESLDSRRSAYSISTLQGRRRRVSPSPLRNSLRVSPSPVRSGFTHDM